MEEKKYEHLLSVQDLHTTFLTENGEVQAVNGVNFWEREKGQFHPEPVAKPVIDGNKASWKVKTRWTKPE